MIISRNKVLLLKLVLMVSFLLLQGCSVKVAPWERGNLAKAHMAITPAVNREAFRQHVFTSKEASQGGYGGIGGGCGCN